MPQCDARIEPGEVLAGRIVQLEFSAFDESHHRGGRHRLADGSDEEGRILPGGTEGLFVLKCPALDAQHRRPQLAGGDGFG